MAKLKLQKCWKINITLKPHNIQKNHGMVIAELCNYVINKFQKNIDEIDKIANYSKSETAFKVCDHDGIRTHDLLIRSQAR